MAVWTNKAVLGASFSYSQTQFYAGLLNLTLTELIILNIKFTRQAPLLDLLACTAPLSAYYEVWAQISSEYVVGMLTHAGP